MRKLDSPVEFHPKMGLGRKIYLGHGIIIRDYIVHIDYRLHIWYLQGQKVPSLALW